MRPALSQLPNGGGDEIKMQIRILGVCSARDNKLCETIHNRVVPRPLRFPIVVETLGRAIFLMKKQEEEAYDTVIKDCKGTETSREKLKTAESANQKTTTTTKIKKQTAPIFRFDCRLRNKHRPTSKQNPWKF